MRGFGQTKMRSQHHALTRFSKFSGKNGGMSPKPPHADSSRHSAIVSAMFVGPAQSDPDPYVVWNRDHRRKARMTVVTSDAAASAMTRTVASCIWMTSTGALAALLECPVTMIGDRPIARAKKVTAPAINLAWRYIRLSPYSATFAPGASAASISASSYCPTAGFAVSCRYPLKRWAAMTRYCENGILEISNNLCENSLRGVSLGRKNWLFVGSVKGGEAAALFYSLVETCRLNGIEPEAYLTDDIERIGSHPINRIDELLPWNWRAVQDIKLVA